MQTDLIVIGTGSAAASAAYKCRSAGWSVTVVDSRPFGGTCQLRGCDPKKVLVGAAELVDWNRRMQGNGVPADCHTINWADLMRFKRTFTDGVPEQNEQSFEAAGIHTVHGRARFVDRTTMRVGDDTFSAPHIVIAAGARRATLNIPGEEHLTSSTEFLELDRLPSEIVFVGGGYIAFELAHVAVRAGARVHIVHRGARPLPRFDPDLVDRLVEATRELGVEVHLNTSVERIEPRGDRLMVHAADGRAIETDMAVHSAGRVPEIDDMDLQAGGVVRAPEAQNGGVAVNEYLQSVSNPAVYAAGDAVASGGFPLTPVAGMQGAIVASNLLMGNHRTPDYTGIPSVVFTVPPLASVGLQEAAAIDRGLHFKTNYQDTAGWYTSRRIQQRHSGFKILVEEKAERILGAHLLGADAENVINLFALAIRHGLRSSDLKHMVYSYPTSSSDVIYMV